MREEITKAQLAAFGVDETCTLGFFDFSTYRCFNFDINSPINPSVATTV